MVGHPLDRFPTVLAKSLLAVCGVLAFAACSTEPPQRSAEPPQRSFVGEFGADFGASFGTTENLLILGGGFATGIMLDGAIGAHVEGRMAHFFDNTDVIPNGVGDQLDLLGSGLFLFSAAGAWYGGARYWGSPYDQEASLAMLSALSITGITTLGMKTVLNDGRPNGASGGYPSGHSSMAMAAASSLAESYGWKVGVPAYLAAVAVGVQRLDSRQHDLDDIIGGFVLGYVVGHSIADRRLPPVLGGELKPIIDPIGREVGLVLVWDF